MPNYRGKNKSQKIYYIKNSINCILENGAYSDKNYQCQMNKKSDNYNEFEKQLVTLAYKQKKMLGIELQKEIFEYLSNDEQLIEYLKTNDTSALEMLKEMKKNAKRL